MQNNGNSYLFIMFSPMELVIPKFSGNFFQKFSEANASFASM